MYLREKRVQERAHVLLTLLALSLFIRCGVSDHTLISFFDAILTHLQVKSVFHYQISNEKSQKDRNCCGARLKSFIASSQAL